MAVTIEDIRAAARLIEGQVERTPCLASRTLSEILGCEVVLKFENLQYTAAFKDRGACVKLASLSKAERGQGVIAMSAGNHAQGVAHHARRLGIDAVIVMPRFTPFMKVENTRRLGARVELVGDSLDEAAAHAHELAAREGRVFIHPYDDPHIIAGQGTIALEMLADHPGIEVLVVPIGGGGLIAGIATAARALSPGIEIIGVEAALYPSVYRALAGLPPAPGGPTIADGIAVKTPGRLTLPIIRELVAGILLVEEAALEAAILMLLEIEKTVAEGAGAAGLAAVASYPQRFAGRRVGIVIGGGNIDSRLLSAVILRGLVRTRRLVRLRISVPDTPGSLARITGEIAERGGNIVEVMHQRAFSSLSVKLTEIEVVIETRNAEHAAEITTALAATGFPASPIDPA